MKYDEFEYIRFDRKGDVLVVTIDRPDDDLNAVDERLHHELTALFPALQSEQDARAIVLTGSGKAFCAGGDFGWFPSLQTPGRLEKLRLDAKNMIWDLLDVPQPIVCVLNGHAMGLGASLALLCDVIFASDDARIGDPHVKVGVVAGDGGTAVWPLAVGPAKAKQYLLTGDALGAADAERLGLINFVVPKEELMRQGLAFAERLAAGAPLAVQYTKLAVNKLIKDALNTSFDVATALEIVTFQSEDHKEALEAIAAKRAPRFRGR